MSYQENVARLIKSIPTPNQFTLSSPFKVSLQDRCSFNLPCGPNFCPGATMACKDCYAQKKRFVFSAVQKVAVRNYKLAQKYERMNRQDLMAKKLLDVIDERKAIFRLSGSGDFESQFQVDVWYKVIQVRPNTKFWAYTRSFKFNYQKIVRLQNFNLFASTDMYNEVEAQRFLKRYQNSSVKAAFGPWERNKEIPHNSFLCPAITGKIEAKGACERCRLCVDKRRTKKNVVFLRH